MLVLVIVLFFVTTSTHLVVGLAWGRDFHLPPKLNHFRVAEHLP
jgi:hypothetical protein